MTLPLVEANTMRPSGAKVGSKLWIGAPLSVHPGAFGGAAMSGCLAHAVPSTFTVQMANGSASELRAAKATLSPFHDTDGWRISAVATASPAQLASRLVHAPPTPAVTAPVVASVESGVKHKSDD